MKPGPISRALLAAAVAGAALTLPAHAQQDASVIQRATELRDAPGTTGASLGALAADSPVERTGERKGSWIKVRTPQGIAGWVHMFDVGTRASAAPASGNAATSGLRSLGGLFGGNAGTTTATSTAGIRGLDAEDIANAQPNLAAVTQAEQQRVNAEQARRFAGAASLQAHQVAALPEPAPPASTSAPAGRINPMNENISPN